MRFRAGMALGATLVLCFPAAAQSLKPDEVYSSIMVTPTSDPNPVMGADGRTHLAYELVVTNPSNLFVTLEKVEAIDQEGAMLRALQDDDLAAMMLRFGATGATLAPGATAIVFM